MLKSGTIIDNLPEATYEVLGKTYLDAYGLWYITKVIAIKDLISNEKIGNIVWIHE